MERNYGSEESRIERINRSLDRTNSSIKQLAVELGDELYIPLWDNPISPEEADFMSGYSGHNDIYRLEYVKTFPEPYLYNLGNGAGMRESILRAMERKNEDRAVSVRLRKKLEAGMEDLGDEVHRVWRNGPTVEALRICLLEGSESESYETISDHDTSKGRLFCEVKQHADGNASTSISYTTSKSNPAMKSKINDIHAAAGVFEEHIVRREVDKPGISITWFVGEVLDTRKIRAAIEVVIRDSAISSKQ
ncbi:MAG: hypothetical protein ACQESR_03890 [Planctomycetota bacterium]